MGPGGKRVLVEDSERELAGRRIDRPPAARVAMLPGRSAGCFSGSIIPGDIPRDRACELTEGNACLV